MKKQSPGAERQELYRWRHPQVNITLQSPEEQHIIRQACMRQHTTPRQVLLAWVAQVQADPPSQR